MVLSLKYELQELASTKAANFVRIWKNKSYDQLEAGFFQKMIVSDVACQINVSIIYTRMVECAWLQEN